MKNEKSANITINLDILYSFFGDIMLYFKCYISKTIFLFTRILYILNLTEADNKKKRFYCIRVANSIKYPN